MENVEQESINKKSLIPAKHVGAHIYQGQLRISKLIKVAFFGLGCCGQVPELAIVPDMYTPISICLTKV